MKLKIANEKLDELAVNSERSHDLQMMCDDGVNMDSLMQVTNDSFFNGYRAAEQVHQATVDKLIGEIKRISDESTHGDNCRAVIYHGIRNCDCHKSVIDKMMKELKES